MFNFRLLAAILISSFAMIPQGYAECFWGGQGFFFAQGGSYNYTLQVTDGTSCNRGWNVGGTGTYTGMSVISSPKSGSLIIKGVRPDYTVKAGFKGKDQFALKVCGTSRQGNGCVDINVDVTSK